MTTRKHPSRAGRYYRWFPVDEAIFERLPAEGTMVGYQVIAATVRRLTAAMNEGVPPEGQVTSNQVQTRLRSMKVAGLAVSVPVMGAGGTQGWQRTRKGELKYAEMTGRTLGPNGPAEPDTEPTTTEGSTDHDIGA